MNIGVWFKIIGKIKQLHDSDIIHGYTCRKRIGNGETTMFWKDTWLGEIFLMNQFPRLLLLEM